MERYQGRLDRQGGAGSILPCGYDSSSELGNQRDVLRRDKELGRWDKFEAQNSRKISKQSPANCSWYWNCAEWNPDMRVTKRPDLQIRRHFVSAKYKEKAPNEFWSPIVKRQFLKKYLVGHWFRGLCRTSDKNHDEFDWCSLQDEQNRSLD